MAKDSEGGWGKERGVSRAEIRQTGSRQGQEILEGGQGGRLAVRTKRMDLFQASI